MAFVQRRTVNVSVFRSSSCWGGDRLMTDRMMKENEMHSVCVARREYLAIVRVFS